LEEIEYQGEVHNYREFDIDMDGIPENFSQLSRTRGWVELNTSLLAR
jgi:hypothetical protein